MYPWLVCVVNQTRTNYLAFFSLDVIFWSLFFFFGWITVGSFIYRWFFYSQVNLVDWLKMMVGSRRSEEVVDPNIEVRPSTRALKRALLTALRCVDPDSEKRPKMSQVVRMLESEEYPIPREVSSYSIFGTRCHWLQV